MTYAKVNKVLEGIWWCFVGLLFLFNLWFMGTLLYAMVHCLVHWIQQ